MPYAIDFMNPAPDMDINSITPHYFEWAVKAMADFAIEMAFNPRPQRAEQRWAHYRRVARRRSADSLLACRL